ncbi:hypothetical protein AGR3A_Cc250147 [Agrobacterium tomkonis CFBP 6623]|uniref:Uncharacterized protein n=1 Tax=Agrobacterium tomkonis CFBP 6623 TaxID=1183432 RepID=A0A1S7PEJ8_9HYPH|nr:hypothetical protein AGR3A_Cc250147 [Agrobacterium tomkonis CFBP 6623]
MVFFERNSRRQYELLIAETKNAELGESGSYFGYERVIYIDEINKNVALICLCLWQNLISRNQGRV